MHVYLPLLKLFSPCIIITISSTPCIHIFLIFLPDTKTLAWCLGLEEDSDSSNLPHIYYEVNEVNQEWFRGTSNHTSSSSQTNNHGSQLLSKKKIALLLIDPQNCFHPEGGVQGTKSYHSQGSLAVPGASFTNNTFQ